MIQIVKCKCGSVIAACQEPYCYEDVDWMKNVRKYAKKGCIIKIADKAKLESCKCNKENEYDRQREKK